MTERDIIHEHDGDALRALLLLPDAADGGETPRGTVLLVHDAFGLGGFSLDVARRLQGEGYVVFGVDMWGDRRTPGQDGVGPLIGSMVDNRDRWVSRITAAYETAIAQPEVDPDRVVALGYCFGGSTVLELVRSGARLRGAVGVHSGLDMLDPDAAWATPATDRVLVCTGGEDPMATPPQWRALRENLDAAGIDWELNLYAKTVHAFTNPALEHSPRPDVVAYNPVAARRAWGSTLRFFEEALGE